MKYTDGLYHIEPTGFTNYPYQIVNVYGETCFYELEGIKYYLRYTDEDEVDHRCRQMNICPEGAIFADLT